MGVDFISKTRKSFRKRLDQSLVDLGTPDLFTRKPSCQPRTYAGTVHTGAGLDLGEEVIIRFCDGEVIAQRGIDIVAEIHTPPMELVSGLMEAGGVAYGIIQEVYEMAGTVEVAIC